MNGKKARQHRTRDLIGEAVALYALCVLDILTERLGEDEARKIVQRGMVMAAERARAANEMLRKGAEK